MPNPPDRNAFAAGTLYYIADAALRLPGDRTARTVHAERRPVLIVSDQGALHGRNARPPHEWPSVLVVPVSHSTSYRTAFDVLIAAGDGNLVRRGWARIPALQPVDKTMLTDMLGSVQVETLESVTAQILWYLGLIAPAPDE